MALRRPLIPNRTPESPAVAASDTPTEASAPTKVQMKAQNSKIPADLHAELHEAATETGISISKIIADGLRLRLKQLRRTIRR